MSIEISKYDKHCFEKALTRINLSLRLSCNDLKLHGVRAGNKYEDGFQMIRISDSQYLPVYCDMTTSEGAFTLIVTSAQNNWTRAQVPRR